MSTVGGSARAPRGRGSGLVRVAVLATIVVAAFLVSRGCQRSYVRITKDQAVAIGQKQVDFHPEGHTIRILLRGIPPTRFWAVSYWIRNKKGSGYLKITVVLINANNGKIDKIIVERS